jgi:hypothetical protein
MWIGNLNFPKMEWNVAMMNGSGKEIVFGKKLFCGIIILGMFVFCRWMIMFLVCVDGEVMEMEYNALFKCCMVLHDGVCE